MSVLISADIVFVLVCKFRLVKSVSQSRLQAVKGVRQSIYVANFIAIIRRDRSFANAQTGLVKLNQDVSIEMPLIRVLHKRDLFERGAAIEPVTGMELRQCHSCNPILQPSQNLIPHKFITWHTTTK